MDVSQEDTGLRSRVAAAFVQGTTGQQPRAHQVDAVVSLLSALHGDCHAAGPTNYLLQHATGSGKSLTIALLASQLVGWADQQGGVFHTVLIVNDRLQLDAQLSDTLLGFLTALGLGEGVKRAGSSSELLTFLSAPVGSPSRPRIILTTLQKVVALHGRKPTAAGAGRSSGGGNTASKPQTGGRSSGGGGTTAAAATAAGRKRHKRHQSSTSADADADFTAPATAAGQAAGPPGAQAGPGLAAGGVQGLLQGVRAGSGRIAVIADEAHRSHGHGSTTLITQMLSAPSLTCTSPNLSLTAAATLKALQATGARQGQGQGQPSGLTYIGFSATPSPKALQLFGVAREIKCDVLGDVISDDEEEEEEEEESGGAAGPEGQAAGRRRNERVVEHSPFHAYTMQQAVDEGHVINVLDQFVSITPHLHILGLQQPPLPPPPAPTSTAPGVARRGTAEEEAVSLRAAALIDAASNSRDVIQRKAALVASQFLDMLDAATQEGFTEFRGMVVARSRQHVVWWVQELRAALAAHTTATAPTTTQSGASEGTTRRPVVSVYGAFSGNILVPEGEAVALEQALASAGGMVPEPGPSASSGSDQDSGSGSEGGGGGGGASGGRAGAVVKRGVGGRWKGAGKGRAGGRLRGAGGAGAGSGRKQGTRKNPWDAALSHITSDGVGSGSEVDTSAAQQGGQADAGSGPVSVPSQTARAATHRSTSSRRGRRVAIATPAVSCVLNGDGLGGDSGSDSGPSRSSSSSPSSSSSSSSALTSDDDDDVMMATSPSPGATTSTSSDTSPSHAPSDTPSSSPASPASSSASSSDDDDDEPLIYRRMRLGSSAPATPHHTTSALQTITPDNPSPQLNTSNGAADSPAAEPQRVSQQGARAGTRGRAGGSVPPDMPPCGVARVAMSERDINGRGASHTAARILVCCNKFETGYDDPRLAVLFIDRPLQGARAVQVLGRLNRPAPALCKSQQLVHVVDFVNSAGSLSESFAQFWGTTTLRTGRLARRLRLELRMEHAVSRVLEALQPAAVRAALAAHLATQEGTQSEGAASSSSSSRSVSAVAAGALQALTARGAALLAACLPPEARSQVESDVAAYVAAAQALGREAAELPLAWATCMQAEMVKLQKQRERQAANPKSDQESDDDTDQPVITPDIKVSCELQESYRGAIRVAPQGSRPLRTRPLAQSRRAATGSAAARETPEYKARHHRPLGEVIAAANAALEQQGTGPDRQRGADRAARLLATCLTDMCNRLQAATQEPQPTAGGQPANLPASKAGQAPASAGGSSSDTWLAVNVLRRLLLWPVTPALLRDTGAGKLVSRLRKHGNTVVSELADQVTAQWKGMVTAHERATAKAQAQGGSGAAPLAASRSQTLAAGAGGESDVRVKATAMLADALKDHAAAADSGTPLSSERARQLASAIEAAVHAHAARSGSSTERQVYRSRMRLLLPALRLVDGVTPRLLRGEVTAGEVAVMDSAGLASAAVRRQAEEAVRKRAEEADKWERAVAQSQEQETGTSEQVKCKACGGRTSVHTVLTGGTYAQERTVIQKYVCQACAHTWRSDD